MLSFSELLSQYIARSGMSDSELARSVGVRRQTIFRWREGIVKRPRYVEDVERIADRLRLTPDERDQLLIAAGFPPQSIESAAIPEPAVLDASLTRITTVTMGVDPSLPEVEPEALRDAQSPAASSHETKFTPMRWVLVAVLLLSAAGLFVWLWFRFGASPPNPVPPTATSAPAIHADVDETLLLVSEFANYTPDQAFNVAGRVREALASEIEQVALDNTRATIWPAVIKDEGEAQRVLMQSAAAMIIWGEYDSGRVRVMVSLAGEGDGRGWVGLLSSPTDLSSTINVDVPRETQALSLLSLGRLYREQGEYGPARTAFQHALALKPSAQKTEATLHFLLATVLERGADADLDAAIAEYSRVLPLRPDWVNARYNRGRAYLQRYYEGGEAGLPDAAIADFSWAIEQQPAFADARLNRGIAYYARNRAGDLEAAYDDMSAAIELAPDDYRLYYNRGLVNIRRNDAEWQSDLAHALDRNPDHAASESARCWGHALDQQPVQALPHCERAVELGADGSIHDSFGIVYALQGRTDEAISELEAYLDWLHTFPETVYDRYNGPLVEGWIVVLADGEMPFDDEALIELRK